MGFPRPYLRPRRRCRGSRILYYSGSLVLEEEADTGVALVRTVPASRGDHYTDYVRIAQRVHWHGMIRIYSQLYT